MPGMRRGLCGLREVRVAGRRVDLMGRRLGVSSSACSGGTFHAWSEACPKMGASNAIWSGIARSRVQFDSKKKAHG